MQAEGSRNNAQFGCGSTRTRPAPFYSQLGSSLWGGGTVNDQRWNHCYRRIEKNTGSHCFTRATSSPSRCICSPLIHKYLSGCVHLSSSPAALGEHRLGLPVEERGRVSGQRAQRLELEMALSWELYKTIGKKEAAVDKGLYDWVMSGFKSVLAFVAL